MTHGNIAVRAQGLGKRYFIGAQRSRYRTFRDVVGDAVLTPFRRASAILRGHATGAADLHQALWALRDVTFDVAAGEVVGIIGRNGAGKTTLLKVLSRITEPTAGKAEIHGRVASLLEVGTGFHPELTGRENIYLNGAILGMRRTEIDRKFDEIVEFSEVGRFLETPVKHYSSGMYVRLAFAVAAHLEPEILIVDEVLSVGDAAFQKKCLGKMEDVASHGRTVLFVSHNMSAVARLCERALLLQEGRIVMDGSAPEVVSRYLTSGAESSGVWVFQPEAGGQSSRRKAELERVEIVGSAGGAASVVGFADGFDVDIRYEVREPIRNLVAVCEILDEVGTSVLRAWDTDTTDLAGQIREPGSYSSRCKVPPGLLRPGAYTMNFGLYIPNVGSVHEPMELLTFEISEQGYPANRGPAGVIGLPLEWRVTREPTLQPDVVGREAS